MDLKTDREDEVMKQWLNMMAKDWALSSKYDQLGLGVGSTDCIQDPP